MRLIRQRSSWAKGERTLVPLDVVVVPLVFNDDGTHPSSIAALVECLHDVRFHTGLLPARIELTMGEWHRIITSRSFLATVKYCGPMAMDTPPDAATPEMLAAMLGVEVRVAGVAAANPKPPPPPVMSCRNCGAPPKFGRADCAHCGTPYAKGLGATGHATLPVGSVVEFVTMPAPRVPLDRVPK